MHHMLRLPFYADDGAVRFSPDRPECSLSASLSTKRIFSKRFLRETFIVLCCFSFFSPPPPRLHVLLNSTMQV